MMIGLSVRISSTSTHPPSLSLSDIPTLPQSETIIIITFTQIREL